ncbi:GNA1162 family protein [Thermodesulfovibrio sp. 3907-1M]|uniref:GNA1162 family protein n=1 Tax=Thermodesulfovibrio autotrophicus TaxID=3118333 RepID=A0AAU8GUQ2_9BACT
MKKTLFVFFIVLFIASCATMPEVKKETPQGEISEEELPKTVAILPFENKTEELGIANQVRKAFYNHFSSKPYRDIELNIVDEKIVQLEKSKGKNILDIQPKEICEALGCDGLIYGRVTDYKKIYAVAYSQLGIEAEVWMINTRTAKEILRLKDSVRYHEGGVPLSPLSAVITAISTAMNIRDIQQVRMLNELCYKFNAKIPSPSGIVEERPVIKEVLTNAKDSPFGKGKLIQVGLEGDRGMVATFDIGNFKRGIAMKETQPGIYIGEYVVMPGDNVKEAPIVVSLRKPGGYETQWIDVSGFITIDTTPPPQVTGLRAKGFHDRIEVSWQALKNVSDLKGYKILRSEQPLTGFKEIGKVELSFFEDRALEHGKVYYYRVIAYDTAGNESEIQDSVKASLTTIESQIISGTIERDTVLSGIYIVKDSLRIPKGLTLTVEPETRIMFHENSELTVEGKIVIDAKDASVEFVSATDKKWKGITVKEGDLNINGFRLKNAHTGLILNSARGFVENGVITYCDTGILISGIPSASIKNLTISGNKTGIELLKTDSTISMNNIFQNETGIKINGFSGEIKDNNIYDNTLNISSETIVKIAPNYFGSINIDEMKLKNIHVSSVYNLKLPEGKVVNAIANPYSGLSQEERQRKATELVIEGGNYFRQRNYGKAVTLFEKALKAQPTAEVYYYLAVCYQEMREDEKALNYLVEGVEKFPKDSTLKRSLGLMYYQAGKEDEAKKIFEEVLRLNPEDRQVRFLMERLTIK